jgi:hypothetical protein
MTIWLTNPAMMGSDRAMVGRTSRIDRLNLNNVPSCIKQKSPTALLAVGLLKISAVFLDPAPPTANEAHNAIQHADAVIKHSGRPAWIRRVDRERVH